MTGLQRPSPCKINLVLNVLGKRPDGFHELETLMHPIALTDILTFERLPGAGIELSCSNQSLPTDASNLVYRAASGFLQKTARKEGFRIHLEKRIPLAAGLGGGSGNAAVTLVALNDLSDRPLGPADLQELAATLGSDVPFFLQPSPALAVGRGERICSVEPFPALAGCYVLLIHPGFGVSTAWAYQALAGFPEALNGRKGRAEKLVALLRSSTLAEAAPHFYNSLESPVLRKYPVLQLYQEFLRAHGADVALMSGSGSTTFGLFRNEAAAREAADLFRQRFGQGCWTAIVSIGPAISA
ncbi:MAG: 4-(cytidine 5'-diphospho)-2-C-methyl-D-erythritol kinase [Verrucomicrobiota bacterium]